jgi:hypothetical protein
MNMNMSMGSVYQYATVFVLHISIAMSVAISVAVAISTLIPIPISIRTHTHTHTQNRSVYRAICVHHTEERSQRIIRLLKTVPVLNPLSDYEMDKLATAMELTTVKAGDVVIKEGEKVRT